jgi:GPH family glycoside/pentoside/hexuronide:cation symporter
VREPPRRATPNRTPWRSAADAWHNGPFRILLLAYGVGSIGAALPATLVLFYVEHVLRAPGLAEVFLSLYFVSGFAFLPAWTRVARRVGKKAAWLSAMAVNVGAFVFALFLGPGDVVEFGAVCVVSGIGFGAGLVLPNSLVSDAIDFDELQSGQRRDGLYFGLWSIVTKLSAAVGAAAALPVLKWSGYVAQGEQPETALLALRLLYAGVPIACYAAGLALAARFPIGEEEHRHIRAAIDARDRGTEGARP